MPFALPPHRTRWAITGARVPACLLAAPPGARDHEGLVAVDLVIAADRIESITPAADKIPDDLPVLHRPGLIVPAFVDAHTHLDKGHIWPRAMNPNGSIPGARETVPVDREAHWNATDVRARMAFGLQAAYAYGTRAIRTHLDCGGKQTRISYPVFAELRDAWRDRIDLQASPLFPIELALDEAHMRDVTEMVYAHGQCLGAVTYPGPDLKSGLERLFRLAADKGWALDFHADETNDPIVNALALIAQTAIDTHFQGRILCGHCCTLTLMNDEARKRTIDLVAKAGISIVSLPMCNMYLQERDDPAETPRWRGITALHELKAAGVPVMIASDNTRDPFYAYGDLDMAEVWREGTRIAHLDHPFGDWPRAVSATPSEALGLDGTGLLRVGGEADFVMFPARSMSEFMARPLADRTVVRHGRPIDADAPGYEQLDRLEGLRV
jgi:cytosine deaminase